MTVRIGAIMVLKTVMTVIIFSPGEDGQSMLLVNHAAAYEWEPKMPSCQGKLTRSGWSWIQLETRGSNKAPTKDAESKTQTKN